MPLSLYKNIHYNTPGHAHELTFSAFRRHNVFFDHLACELFLEELGIARKEFSFQLWAYVIMPNHVHLLIWPLEHLYKIELINKAIKGRMAKRYIKFHKEKNDILDLRHLLVVEKGTEQYRVWQPGGGFDRNLWNAKSIHESIGYIEANPVRKKLAASPEDYRWSSAFTRENNTSLVPDKFTMPVALPDAQFQRTGTV